MKKIDLLVLIQAQKILNKIKRPSMAIESIIYNISEDEVIKRWMKEEEII